MVRLDTERPSLDDPVPYRELELLQAITHEAHEKGLAADIQPAIGPMRPDLIVRRAQRPALVIEVKREQGTIHFAGLSQVTAYGKTLEALSGGPIYPVLISTGESSDEIESLAETLGVSLVSVHGLDLEHAAEESVRRLAELAELQGHERAVSPDEGQATASAIEVLRNQLAHGASRGQISTELDVEPDELRNLYMTLLTKLEATEPDRLDAIMRAWERTD